MPSNDNHLPTAAAAPPPDAAGQAALLLVESLLHGLVQRSVLTLEQAVDIVRIAVDVQVEVAGEADGAGAPMWQAHAQLTRLMESMAVDIAQS